MSLDLDPRQRAMLQEMGVHVWAPQPAPAPSAAQPPAAPAQPAARAAPPAAARPPAQAVPDAPPPVSGTASAAPGWLLLPPAALYPEAPPAADAPRPWLVLCESAHPDAPLTGDAGLLLDQMLRALRLHRPARAYAACLQRLPRGAAAPGDGAALQDMLAQLQPAVVLALGLAPARFVLGGQEPLGKLRAHSHRLPGGTPLVVSYDPAYLLRAPDAKAGAWADLCRALALSVQ